MGAIAFISNTKVKYNLTKSWLGRCTCLFLRGLRLGNFGDGENLGMSVSDEWQEKFLSLLSVKLLVKEILIDV